MREPRDAEVPSAAPVRKLTSKVAWRCRSSSRGYGPPASRLDAVGFRVLRTVP